MEEAGLKIKSFKDWKFEMLKLSEKAVSENRLLNAAFYYRAAEFYTKSNDPDKEVLYNKFINLFYKIYENDEIEIHKVPYEGTFLPALRIPPSSVKRGTILIHGGFDSFLEEWYSIMKYFSNHGYVVIGFEGPGQGAALRKYGLPLTYEWEKPTKVILDFFHLNDVTLLGLSMGGWFCLRASAFESRIKRVIATGHAVDYMKSMNPIFRIIHLWCMEHCRDFMNRMATMKFEKREGMTSWVVDHLKYITKKNKPLDALEIYLLMNDRNIHSEDVRQDVLLLSGSEDHFIPLKMHALQIKALTNAKSVTGRIFTKKDHAENHCQIGNMGLALDFMVKWINDKSG
jgi:pimeloyl-ACP methyl ester carboxylesterase